MCHGLKECLFIIFSVAFAAAAGCAHGCRDREKAEAEEEWEKEDTEASTSGTALRNIHGKKDETSEETKTAKEITNIEA